MYYICKLLRTWEMFNVQTKEPHPINTVEMGKLSALFGPLIAGEGRIYVAIQVGDIPPNKLKGKLAPGAYISKFHNVWGIYDADTDKSRVLTDSEIDLLLHFFPALFGAEAKLHITVHASNIPPHKLKNIQLTETPPTLAKKSETQARA